MFKPYCWRAHSAVSNSLSCRLWDGLGTGDMRILVLGATNRPTDIDSAILRRMPKRFEIRLPDADQRTRVLSLLLRQANLEPDFDVKELVVRTAGYSGMIACETHI